MRKEKEKGTKRREEKGANEEEGRKGQYRRVVSVRAADWLSDNEVAK